MKQSHKTEEIVRTLHEISSSEAAMVGHTIAIGVGNPFIGHFVLNNIPDHISEVSFLIEDIEDALLAISIFSEEPKRTAQEAKEKFKYDENKPLYLHYFRTLKGQ